MCRSWDRSLLSGSCEWCTAQTQDDRWWPSDAWNFTVQYEAARSEEGDMSAHSLRILEHAEQAQAAGLSCASKDFADDGMSVLCGIEEASINEIAFM